MRYLPPSGTREKGIAVILMSVLMVFIVPITGLAIDASIMYWLKSKMQASADGAAIASARSLSAGLTLGVQEAAAQSRAIAYYNANFPSGFMGSYNGGVTASVSEQTRTRVVTVNSSVTASTYFMKVANALVSSGPVPDPTINVSATAVRRDVNVIVVLDRSGSMMNNNACAAMQTAAVNFIDNFANLRDRIGMISFASAVTADFPMSQSFKGSGHNDANSIYGAIGRVACDGSTNTATAFWDAYQALVALNQPGALNMIVFMTDGLPTALSANLPIKTNADTRYDWSNPTGSIASPASNCRNGAGNKYPATAAPNEPIISGALATYTSYWADQGDTWGLNIHHGTVSGTTVNTNEKIAVPYPNGGCVYGSNGWPAPRTTPSQFAVRNDISYVPNVDLYGNSTLQGYKPVTKFIGGAYNNYIRPDMPSSVRGAAFNAADSAASRMRTDTQTGVLVYTIGLGGNDAEGIDTVFLKRLTNTTDSPIYASTAPAGTYLYAPNITQLNQMFQQVASQILRIAK